MHRNRNRIVTAEKSQPISQKESLRTSLGDAPEQFKSRYVSTISFS